jgi:uncharacterized protein DUF5683
MDSVDCCFSSSRSRTRSRRNDAAALALALAFLAPAPSFAQGPAAQGPTPPARVDSLPHRSKPFFVMARSAVVPGWGQLYNHKVLKAGVVVAGEGLLVYEAVSEWKKENDSVDRLSALLDAGLGPGDAAYDAEDLDREAHRNRKINWIWWGLAAHLLSMMDAYVDAHLASFDADFGPPTSARDFGEKPRLTLAFRTRF